MKFEICLRCHRRLTNLTSRNIGYGSHCYRQMKKENKRQTALEEYL